MMDMLQKVVVIPQIFHYSLFRQSEMNCTKEMEIPEQNQRLSEKGIQGGTVVLDNLILDVIHTIGFAALVVAAAEAKPSIHLKSQHFLPLFFKTPLEIALLPLELGLDSIMVPLV